MSAKSRLLGRGLAALIPDSALDLDSSWSPHAPADRADGGSPPTTVPIDAIRPNPEQPRTVFEPGALAELTASVKAHGILQPLVVRRENGAYVLVAGERRLRAAGLAGLQSVPVVIREAEARPLQLELALVENLQRSDLDPIEAARGFQRLVDEYGYTQDQVAAAVGKDRSTVANAVRLLKLPEFALQALRDGRITAGHARALLPLATEDDVRRILARILAQSLNVRQTERLVSDHVRAPQVVHLEKPKERTLAYATRLLEESLHTSVAIRPGKKGGGRIVLDYADAEDLERLIGLLRQGRRDERARA